MASFNPAKDIPNLSGKVIFITGGNAGLGKEAALQLAHHNPSKIIIASRSIEKGQATIASILNLVPNAKLQLIQLDLTSLTSVHTAAQAFLNTNTRLDILMNNAGIMAVPPALTTDGYEIQFGTNHLGHALLTKLLLPILLRTAEKPGSDIRIINLSSDAHHRAPKEGIQFKNLSVATEPSTALTRYGQSKLANILYSKELARRYPSIRAVAIHPGMVNTNLAKTMKESFLLARLLEPVVRFWHGVSVEEGVKNQVWAVGGSVVSGKYYVPVGKMDDGSLKSRDMDVAGRLWTWTEGELDKFLASV